MTPQSTSPADPGAARGGIIRLAFLVTHPTQYQTPLLRLIAAEPGIELKVFFCSDYSTREHWDPGFGRAIEWDISLLDGYEHEFLPAFGGRERMSFWRPYSHGLAKRLRAGNFDTLWIHGYARWFHWVAMFSARRLGIKVLLSDEATPISTPRGPLKRLAKTLFFGALKQACNGFLAIGSLNREYYLERGVAEDRIFHFPYAVDNARFQAAAATAAERREALRAELGLEAGRPIILFVAKLIPRKRAGDLLEAYSRLSVDPAFGAPYLVFVGDGELRTTLERHAAAQGLDSVRFLGFKNQSELPGLYDLADVFVLPSVREPWGLVVNEAMNAGRAVIVSDQIGCAPDLVRNGENGFIFEAGDIDALAPALHGVIADAGRCRAMGRKSLEIIDAWGYGEEIAGLKRALEFVAR